MPAQLTIHERVNRAIRIGFRVGFAFGALIGSVAALCLVLPDPRSWSVGEILGSILPMLLLALVLGLGTGVLAGAFLAGLGATLVRATKRRPVLLGTLVGAMLGLLAVTSVLMAQGSPRPLAAAGNQGQIPASGYGGDIGVVGLLQLHFAESRSWSLLVGGLVIGATLGGATGAWIEQYAHEIPPHAPTV